MNSPRIIYIIGYIGQSSSVAILILNPTPDALVEAINRLAAAIENAQAASVQSKAHDEAAMAQWMKQVLQAIQPTSQDQLN